MSQTADNYLEALGIEVGDEVKHAGVKGMKWGVRKDAVAVAFKKSSELTEDQRRKRLAAQAILTGGLALYVGSPALKRTALSVLQSAAAKKVAADGAKFAASMLADSRGLTSYSTIGLKLVDGVWK